MISRTDLRAILGLLAWAGSAACAIAQDFAVPLDLPARATINQTIERSREKTTGETTTRGSAVYRYRQDLTPTDTGYRVVQTLISSEGATAASEDLPARPPRIVFDADESLTPLRVVDWQGFIAPMLEAMRQTPAVDQPSQAALDRMRAMFSGLTPEQGAGMLLVEQNFVALPQMAGLDLGKLIQVEGEAPNPFGGPPFVLSETVQLQSIDRRAGKAIVTFRSIVDPAKAVATLSQTLRAMIPEGAIPADELEKAQFEQTRACRYEMDLKTGLTARAECSANSKVRLAGENLSQIDRWVITQALARP